VVRKEEPRIMIKRAAKLCTTLLLTACTASFAATALVDKTCNTPGSKTYDAEIHTQINGHRYALTVGVLRIPQVVKRFI
jgi:hypothetical protein